MRKLFAIVLVAASSAAAQSPVEARTIELKHLRPAEAVKLLSPYIENTGGGVYQVSDKLPIITIRDVPDNIPKMEAVLAKYDHSPATIRFVFQLIEADTSPRMVSASNQRVSTDLDSTLRSVLRFPSYRLIGQGVATVGEFAILSQLLAQSDAAANYALMGEVGTIRLQSTTSGVPTGQVDTAAIGTVSLKMSLNRVTSAPKAGTFPSENLMSTGLDVPLGQTVVLGTAAGRAGGKALILTVKPELVRNP
jgi:type II secretory pathway component GspD/PulD (secretin)